MRLEQILRAIGLGKNLLPGQTAEVPLTMTQPNMDDEGVSVAVKDGTNKLHQFAISSSPVFGEMEVVIPARDDKAAAPPVQTLEAALDAYGYTNLAARSGGAGKGWVLIVNNGTEEWNFSVKGNTVTPLEKKANGSGDIKPGL